MRYTTVTTTKGQLTIPKTVRDKLGLKSGIRVDIYPTENGFIGTLHRKSRIMDVLGDLEHLDKGEKLNDIREKAQKLAAKDIVARMNSK